MLYLLALLTNTAFGAEYLFHGKSVSYDHQSDNRDDHRISLYRDGTPIGLVPEHHTQVYNYEMNFFDHTAMVQLDHDDLASIISQIHCSDNMASLDLCFAAEEDRTMFWAELQAEVETTEHNDKFIVTSSSHEQLLSCRRHMDRVHLIRSVDMDSCVLSAVEGHSCLSCSHTHKLNHGDLIEDGYLNIVNTMHHESPDHPVGNGMAQDSKPVAKAKPSGHVRRLLQTREYRVQFYVAPFGGTNGENPTYVVIEGTNGEKTEKHLLDPEPTDGDTLGRWYPEENDYYIITDIDVGDISRVYLVNYDSNKLCVTRVSVYDENNEELFAWYSFLEDRTDGLPRCVEYEEKYDLGCGVAEFAAGNRFQSDSREESPCEVIPPEWEVVEPRVYNVEIDVCDFFLADTEETVYVILEGHLGVSEPIALEDLTTKGVTYTKQITLEKDIGSVNHVHLVINGDDGLWMDRVSVSTLQANSQSQYYEWEWEFGLFWGKLDVGCAGFDYSPIIPLPGCGVFTVDFGKDRGYDVNQIPCEIMPDQYVNASKWDLLVTWAHTSFQKALETIVKQIDFLDIVEVDNTTDNSLDYRKVEFADGPFELPFECNKDIRDFNVSFNGTYSHDGNYTLSLKFVGGVVIQSLSEFNYEKALSVDFEAFSNGMVTVLDIDQLIYSGPLYTYGLPMGPVSVGVGIGLDLRVGGQLRTDTYIRGRYDWNVWGTSSLEYNQPDGNLFTPILQPYYHVDRDFNFDIDEFTTDTFVSVFVFPILSLFVDAVIDQRNLISVGIKPSLDVQFWYDSNMDIQNVETCKVDLEVHFGLAVGIGTQILPQSPYYELFNQKWPVYDGCLDTTILKIANFTEKVSTTIAEKKQAIHEFIDNRKGCIKKKICRSSFNESRHQCSLPIWEDIREAACTETTALDVIERNLAESWGRIGKVYQGTKCLLLSKYHLLKEFLLGGCDSSCTDAERRRRRRLLLGEFSDKLFGVVMNLTDFEYNDESPLELLSLAANATITKARHFVKAVADYIDFNATAIKKNAVRLMKVTSETVQEASGDIIETIQCVATEMEDVEMDPQAILAAATSDRTIECVANGITTTSEILVENMEQYNFALKAIPAIVTLTDVSVELLTQVASAAQGASFPTARRRLQAEVEEANNAVSLEDFALGDGAYFGNLVCQRCHEGECDSAIKHFQMDVYENGQKAQLSSNYMGNYALGNLDVIFDEDTLMHCIGNVMCGTMEIPIGGENRFFFGEVFNGCRASHFCGFDPHDQQNITTFVFWEGLEEPVEDDLYSWEDRVVATDLSAEICEDVHSWVTLPPIVGGNPDATGVTEEKEDAESGGMSTGAIIGIVIGALCGIVFIGIVLVMCINRSPRGKAGFEQTANDGYNN